MGTSSVRTLAVNCTKRVGHTDIIVVCRQIQCDIVGLQETRRDGQDGFTAAGFTVYCSGAGGGGAEAKGQHRVEITMEESILQDVEKG